MKSHSWFYPPPRTPYTIKRQVILVIFSFMIFVLVRFYDYLSLVYGLAIFKNRKKKMWISEVMYVYRLLRSIYLIKLCAASQSSNVVNQFCLRRCGQLNQRGGYSYLLRQYFLFW